MSNYPQFETVVLKKMKYAFLQYFSPEMVDDIQVSLHNDFDTLWDDICMRIKVFIWADEEPVKHYEFSYPADWWQAFKERWFPTWLLKRHPVIMKKHVIDVKCTYPDYRPRVKGQRFVFRVVEDFPNDANIPPER